VIKRNFKYMDKETFVSIISNQCHLEYASTVWFYCRAVYYGCHISLEIVGRVTPKF